MSDFSVLSCVLSGSAVCHGRLGAPQPDYALVLQDPLLAAEIDHAPV
jgi:hypothetical protein